MGHEWIIDVLADLKSFAKQNDLPNLADHLDQASLVASADIASANGLASSATQGVQAGTGTFFNGTGASRPA